MPRLILALVTSLLLSVTALAQDYTAQTAGNVDIATAQLEKSLKPLLTDQVVVEATAWQALLVNSNTAISNAPTAGTDLLNARAGIVDRLTIVLDALDARGGDSKPFRDYITASNPGAEASAIVKGALEWLTAEDGGIQFAINIGLFLLTLFAFKIIASIVAGIVRKAVGRMKGASDLLRDFFVNVTRRVVFFIGLILALKQLGLDITPFVAALGAAGFILGFALQGTLSNFASGLMILIYRPYDIGQVVNVAGTTGSVDAMTLVSTTLKLPDNQRVVIPNNSIWGNVITNVTGQTTRRCDMMFGCGYSDDLQKVQKVLEEIVNGHEKVHKDPAAVIKLHELADSSVNFIVRAWCNTGDYWDVYWDVTRAVKERFDAEGLNIPFPQQEVHMHQLKD